MSSNLRFLSEKSLAVYEINMIEQWTRMHKRNLKVQAVSTLAISLGFTLFAVLAFLVPATLPNIAQLLNR